MLKLLPTKKTDTADGSIASAIALGKACNSSEKVSAAMMSLLIALVVAIAAHYSLLRVPNYFGKKAKLIEPARLCDVVVLGSSHAMFAVRPKSMSTSAMNLANVSQSLEIDRQILSKLLSQPTGVKLVVVPVSYFSFAYNLSSNTETEYRDPLYSIYMGVRERTDFEVLRDPRYWNLVAFYSTFNYPFPFLNAPSVFDDPQVDAHGWAAGQSGPGKISPLIGKERVAGHHHLMHNRLKNENKKAIEQMIDMSRKNGAKVLLLVTPVTTEYSKSIKRRALDIGLKYLSSLANADVHLANYHDDPRFTKRDFADCDHLNQQGAMRFTKLLEQEFIGPMLASNSKSAKNSNGYFY